MLRRTHAPAPARRRSAAITLAVALVAAAPLATAQNGSSIDELRAKREDVRRQKADAASEINTLEASDDEISAALAAIEADIAAQTARIEDVERQLAAATAEMDEANRRRKDIEAQLAELRSLMRRQVAVAFTNDGQDESVSFLDARSLTEAANRRTLIDAQTGRGLDSVDSFRAASEDLEIEKRRAKDASERAAATKDELEGRLVELEGAAERQRALADEVEARLESRLAEAANLASIDASLSGQITQQQEAIAAQLARQRAAEAAAAAAAARSSDAGNGGSDSGGSGGGGSGGGGSGGGGSGGGGSGGGGSGGGGSGGGGSGGGGSGGGGSVPVLQGPSGGLKTVGGITVAASIAGNLQQLLNAASAAGITFGGGGYRSSESQIALRRAHCGSSNYAIYEMPASQCSPPTARPGQSLHEQGLAIDFTQNGRSLNRSSSGYTWLKSNAATYGFYNLPSEPWHWSTTGR